MIALGTARGAGAGDATDSHSPAIPNFARPGHVVDESWGLKLVNRYQI
jgi:hypothetical protein